jgi:carbon monoxide dehydrogenase subunit G
MQLSAFAGCVSLAMQLNCCIITAQLRCSPNGKTRAAKFPRATRRICIHATGSAGATSTDKFIDITLQDERDYPAGRVRLRGSRASRYVRDAALLQERSKCRTTVGWAMKTGSTSSLIARMTTRPSPAWRLAPTASGHDRHRCRRAQSQQAVPGQHLGRGASVDRPGWPAITRL